jgi:hypothetical protein
VLLWLQDAEHVAVDRNLTCKNYLQTNKEEKRKMKAMRK